jgi:hypothetical protein
LSLCPRHCASFLWLKPRTKLQECAKPEMAELITQAVRASEGRSCAWKSPCSCRFAGFSLVQNPPSALQNTRAINPATTEKHLLTITLRLCGFFLTRSSDFTNFVIHLHFCCVLQSTTLTQYHSSHRLSKALESTSRDPIDHLSNQFIPNRTHNPSCPAAKERVLVARPRVRKTRAPRTRNLTAQRLVCR